MSKWYVLYSLGPYITDIFDCVVKAASNDEAKAKVSQVYPSATIKFKCVEQMNKPPTTKESE